MLHHRWFCVFDEQQNFREVSVVFQTSKKDWLLFGRRNQICFARTGHQIGKHERTGIRWCSINEQYSCRYSGISAPTPQPALATCSTNIYVYTCILKCTNTSDNVHPKSILLCQMSDQYFEHCNTAAPGLSAGRLLKESRLYPGISGWRNYNKRKHGPTTIT